MSNAKLKIYTCTPRAFMAVGVDPRMFFCRDMGLQCLTLRKQGIESQVVLLKADNSQEHPDIIRATMEQLESSIWWKQFDLDAVVLGSWANPKYTSIARAIKESGSKLIIRCDTGGCLTNRFDPLWHTFRMSFYASASKMKNILGRYLITNASIMLNTLPFYREKKVVKHLSYADCVAIETPVGAHNLKKLMKRYTYEAKSDTVHYIPHLVFDEMSYDRKVSKQEIIVSVGRWDSYQKNSPLLIKCLVLTLKKYPEYEAYIYGSGQDVLNSSLDDCTPDIKDRIHLLGVADHSEILRTFQSAQIYFMPSRYEGSSIAGEEALCCGMSVVGSGHVNCVQNFVSKKSGSASVRYSELSLKKALTSEIVAWREGGRDPSEISNAWCQEMHAKQITKKMLSVIQVSSKL